MKFLEVLEEAVDNLRDGQGLLGAAGGGQRLNDGRVPILAKARMGQVEVDGGQGEVSRRSGLALLHVVEERAAELFLGRFLQYAQEGFDDLLLLRLQIVEQIRLDAGGKG